MLQHVYCISAKNLSNVERENCDYKLEVCDSLLSVFKNILILGKRFGCGGELIKACAKIILKRSIYCLLLNNTNEVVSDYWVSIGWCNHYSIEDSDCVVGTVYTFTVHRGKGAASIAIALGMEQISNSYPIKDIYIDTAEDNLAMQRVIARLGFIKVKEFTRGDYK